MESELRLIFDILNRNCKYVVLRKWETVLDDSIFFDQKNDIDILCEDREKVIALLNAQPVHKDKKRDNFMVLCRTFSIRLDIRWVGDGYYPKEWEINMLKDRVKAPNNVYRLSDEDCIYALAYHALLQKESVSESYRSSICEIYERFYHNSIASSTDNGLLSVLYRFLRMKGYGISIPKDNAVFMNTKNIRSPFLITKFKVQIRRYYYYLKNLL